MGIIAPIIGVVSAVGGAIQQSQNAAAQNAANALQIEANNREEKIRLMDVEAQRQSNFMDFEVGSQQRLAQLAASLSAAEVQRLDAQTQRAMQNMQITSAQSGINNAAVKGSVDRQNTQLNALSQAAQARGIEIQGVPYDKLASNVVTQRAAIMAALNPMMADMYRNEEVGNVLKQYDTLRSAEGDQSLQLDYANQYSNLLESFANTTRQAGDASASYQQAAQQNSLNATDAMQRSAYQANDALFGINQEMQALGSQIEQLSAYRKVVGNENLANAQAGNIRSATSAKNAEVSRSNRSYSLFDSLSSIAGAGISLFNSLNTPSSVAPPIAPPVGLRVSDSRYDPSYRYTQNGGYFG